ncbi:ribokinase [Novisyntrophococcus fermenticellae]|uniref:ribokinase n=1 Tax=Novisyntrophococcus fermenticellae TaxID=2068655 RepID=UPI001E54397F|nr:ribokinase [Novisyntrophococcus fermenticellae]
MKKEKIAVIGSYAVGMTIVGKHFPKVGETVPGRDFQMMGGGKGSNQAVAAARMGAEVYYGTCVGNDSFADDALKMYEEEQIDASHVRKSRKGLSTGVGLIFVNEEGENEIVIDFAANKEYSREDVECMMPAIRGCRLLLMQLECSMDIVEYAARRCREEGVPFVLNPAPYSLLSDELLGNCTYLIPNESEARQILGLEADDEISDEEVAEKLYARGVENVVMTLGSRGAYIRNAQICKKVAGIPVKAVDTTGAGDTFTGAFCVALAEGRSIREAVRFGNAAAGISVTKYGVIDSIPRRKEVEERLEEAR